MNIDKAIKQQFYECDQHIVKILAAKNHLKNTMPLSVDEYQNFNPIQASFVDQLIFRFSKLQDTMAEKILPAILILSKEDIKRKTFIDILNRLEKLEIINKVQWLKLREVRNEIAHEYSYNQAEVVESIIEIYNYSNDLMDVYHSVKAFCETKFSL